MRYGERPADLGQIAIDCPEMLFYQYLPIKMAGESSLPSSNLEQRLQFLTPMIGKVCCDYVGLRGIDQFTQSYVYLTIKRMYQLPDCSFNREGYHSDGFLTDDINYIWSDKFPTVFNDSAFNITPDDVLSIQQMTEQALPENEFTYPNKHLLRLNQYNIHKVAPITQPAMRTFVKISVSKDKYDLLGNSHNFNLNYSWDMKPRKDCRNIPQTIIS